MDQSELKEGKNQRYSFNLALAAVAGQVGCLTAIIAIGFLLAGLYIDSRLDTRPTFTIILLITSIPITLIAMFWIVRNVTGKLKSRNDKQHNS